MKSDTERAEGTVRSPLHGLPFLVKDNIATAPPLQTTAGSAALMNAFPPRQAHVVTLLLEAGAVLLGKANLSEFASMRASYYAEGYSSHGGQNRNPYNLAHHPGGSSSGPASAVAANMCAFSIGTETDGSIMFPADRCAVVGLKPSLGLVSTEGVIPEARSMDVVGCFGKCCVDVGLVLGVLSERKGDSYSSFINRQDTLKGAKFGIPWKRVWESASENAEVQQQYDTLLKLGDKMKVAGAQLVQVDFPSAEEIISPKGWDWEYEEEDSWLSEFTVVRIEFYRDLKRYLGTLTQTGNNLNSLEDIVAYNEKHTAHEGGIPETHPAWPTGQDNFEKCIHSKVWPEEFYTQALNYIRRKSREEGIDAALNFEGETLDGLLVPLQAEGGAACSVAAKAGYPMISIPVDVDGEGVPFGIGIMQTAGREDLLLKYGSAIEDLVGGRKKPRFLNFEADNYPYVGTPPSWLEEEDRVSEADSDPDFLTPPS